MCVWWGGAGAVTTANLELPKSQHSAASKLNEVKQEHEGHQHQMILTSSAGGVQQPLGSMFGLHISIFNRASS
jgi:hypothetical protein